MTVTCYPSPGKKKGLDVCQSFAAGCGGCVAPPGQDRLEPGPAFFYGWTAHSVPLMEQCRREGHDWYYADNAYYFGRGAYFRVTRNALMHDGGGIAGQERLARFGIEIKPWRAHGDHVLVTTQSDLFYRQRLGIARDAWTAGVVRALERTTKRDVRVCHKPEAKASGNAPAAASFEASLKGAHALVTHSSATAVKALIEGVPVFCIGVCMASIMGLDDLSRIESPVTPGGREQWLRNLAANQWTREEMRNGACWRDLMYQTIAAAA